MNLGPLREALLASAREEAARIEAEASAEAEARLAAARRQAAALVEDARADGAAVGAAAAAHDGALARRRARALRLAAERDVWEELRLQAHAAARALPDRPEYEPLLEQLVAAAQRQLGGSPRLEQAPGGGVRASRNGRSVDYSLDALVERELRRLGEQVDELWR